VLGAADAFRACVDPADVVHDAYLPVRGKFPQYSADPRLPFFLWLRLEVAQKLVDIRRFHLGKKMREASMAPDEAPRRADQSGVGKRSDVKD
jgi:hypothetical protein